MEEAGAPPPDPNAGISDANGTLPQEAAIIEIDITPGAAADSQKMVVENDLTGGHKGGAFTGASVAGAGVQTADDPFGLKITETAPPDSLEQEAGKQFNWAKWHNILMMIVAFLVAGAVAATGVYFGFIRKKNAPTIDPVETITKYCAQVVSGDIGKLSDVATPGSSYQKELSNVLEPYTKVGVLSMKEFKAIATEVTDTNATVEIKKFVVRSLNTGGDNEYVDVLAINTPTPLRSTVSLVKQNGKWLVSN